MNYCCLALLSIAMTEGESDFESAVGGTWEHLEGSTNVLSVRLVAETFDGTIEAGVVTTVWFRVRYDGKGDLFLRMPSKGEPIGVTENIWSNEHKGIGKQECLPEWDRTNDLSGTEYVSLNKGNWMARPVCYFAGSAPTYWLLKNTGSQITPYNSVTVKHNLWVPESVTGRVTMTIVVSLVGWDSQEKAEVRVKERLRMQVWSHGSEWSKKAGATEKIHQGTSPQKGK